MPHGAFARRDVIGDNEGKLMEDVVKKAGLWGDAQQLAFSIITKSGTNSKGKNIHYLFNYSAKAATVSYPFANGKELLSNKAVAKGSAVELGLGVLKLWKSVVKIDIPKRRVVACFIIALILE